VALNSLHIRYNRLLLSSLRGTEQRGLTLKFEKQRLLLLLSGGGGRLLEKEEPTLVHQE